MDMRYGPTSITVYVNVRIALREESMVGVYVEGEHAWAVCRSDALTNRPLFQQLSEPLRLPVTMRRFRGKETGVGRELRLKNLFKIILPETPT